LWLTEESSPIAHRFDENAESKEFILGALALLSCLQEVYH